MLAHQTGFNAVVLRERSRDALPGPKKATIHVFYQFTRIAGTLFSKNASQRLPASPQRLLFFCSVGIASLLRSSIRLPAAIATGCLHEVVTGRRYSALHVDHDRCRLEHIPRILRSQFYSRHLFRRQLSKYPSGRPQ
jgi:hypothetical protein